MSDVTYRAFRRDSDFERAAHLHLVLNVVEAEMGSRRDIGEEAARACLDEDIRLVAEQGGEILVAEIAGKVVGYCSHLLERSGPFVPAEWQAHLYVKNLMVDAAHRGHGIGPALLARAEDFARRSGVKRISLGVVPGNDRAETLYRKQGYHPIATEMAKELD